MDHQSSLNTKSATNGQQAKQSTTPAPSISISGGGAYPPPSLAARQHDNEASLPKGTSAAVGYQPTIQATANPSSLNHISSAAAMLSDTKKCQVCMKRVANVTETNDSLQCTKCNVVVHGKCMNLHADLVKRFVWHCLLCRTCKECEQPADHTGAYLQCQMCD